MKTRSEKEHDVAQTCMDYYDAPISHLAKRIEERVGEEVQIVVRSEVYMVGQSSRSFSVILRSGEMLQCGHVGLADV